MNEPSKHIAPYGVDALHEGATLHPCRAPFPFTIQRCPIEIRPAEELTLGGRKLERSQQVRGGGKRLDVGQVSQHLGSAVRHVMNKGRKRERSIDLGSGQRWWKQRYETMSWRSDQASSGACASGPRMCFKACKAACLVTMRENGQVTMVVSTSNFGASTDTPNGPVATSEVIDGE